MAKLCNRVHVALLHVVSEAKAKCAYSDELQDSDEEKAVNAQDGFKHRMECERGPRSKGMRNSVMCESCRVQSSRPAPLVNQQ